MPFDFIEDAEVKAKVEEEHKLEIDNITVTLKAEHKTAMEAEVSGLKTKNEELLGEKKTLSETLKTFDGIDVDVAKTAIEFHEKNKDAKFLEDGSVDELIEKKTSDLRTAHDTEKNELTTNLTDQTARADKYQTLFESKVIDDGLRAEAVKQGVLPAALEDIILRGRTVFSLGEKQEIEARDSEGKLAQTEDKKILSPKNWIEGLKKTSPHYWPNSVSADADGGSGSSSDIDIQMQAAAEAGDSKLYRKLRDKKAGRNKR